jgi:intein/homing endonuclease/superfamily II DNA or RNA helicase
MSSLEKSDNSLFFVCHKCGKAAFEEPSYEGEYIFHTQCSELATEKRDIRIQQSGQYDPSKVKAHIYISGDVIVIDHPFNEKLNLVYHKYYGLKWNKEKRRREIKKDKINGVSAKFLLREINLVAPGYNWEKSDEVKEYLAPYDNEDSKNKDKIQKLNEMKKDFEKSTDTSHMKIEPFGYQKAGIAFLEEIGGVGLIGDEMGLGKCVIKSHIYINKGLLRIENLFDKFADLNSRLKDKSGGEWFKPNTNLSSLSVDKFGKQKEKKITHLYRERIKTSIKKVFINDGSELHLTIPHKLLSTKGWTSEFKVGDFILLPREINDNSGTKELDYRLNIFFSWLISEGYENDFIKFVEITQNNKATLDNVLKNLMSYCLERNIKINRPRIVKDSRNNTHRLRINSVDLVNHLKTIGYEFGFRSKDKKIPQVVLNSTKKDIAIFLKNYFEAEGCVFVKDGIIEIATASDSLRYQLSFLLRRLGILIRFNPKQKMATNGTRIKRTYYVGIIGGTSLRKFQEVVGFLSQEKIFKLAEACKRKCNDNIDIVPTLDLIKPIFEMKVPRLHVGISSVYGKNQNFSRTTLQEVVSKLDKILSGETVNQYKKLNKSKWTDQTLNIYKNIDYEKLKKIRDELNRRLNLNVFYLQIKDIQIYNYEGYVYDLTVKDNHNYIANGVYCHNTAQAIGYTSKNNFKTIVVTLASLKYNWKKEVEKFTHKTAVVIDKGFELADFNKYDYFITNYDQLNKWSKQLTKMKFDCVILDESHSIANVSAARTKNVNNLFKKIPHRILLSGTPSKNRPIELYSQLKFLKPKEFPNKQDFGLRYCDPTQGYSGFWEFKGASNLDELNERMAPFYVRRLKSEVLKDLPEKRISNLVFDMDSPERKEYNKLTGEFLKNSEALGNDFFKTKASLMTLMKYCSKAKVPHVIDFVGTMLKEDLTRTKKVVIFAYFKETQQFLKNHFKDSCVSLLGDDDAEARQAAVDRFQTDPNIKIFIGSTKAAGTGITLTAADTVIFADLLWTPADLKQAEDRLHRISQKNTVFVYYMTFLNCVEELVWNVLQSKLLVVAQTVGDIPFDEDAAVKEIISVIRKSKA